MDFSTCQYNRCQRKANAEQQCGSIDQQTQVNGYQGSFDTAWLGFLLKLTA